MFRLRLALRPLQWRRNTYGLGCSSVCVVEPPRCRLEKLAKMAGLGARENAGSVGAVVVIRKPPPPQVPVLGVSLVDAAAAVNPPPRQRQRRR